MPVEIVQLLRQQGRLRKQPCGKESGLSLLCTNAANTIEELDCKLALAESISWANHESTKELLKLNKEHSRLKVILGFYQRAINKIDDRFEYANESIEDRQTVHKILDELTENLSQYATRSPKETKIILDNYQAIHREG